MIIMIMKSSTTVRGFDSSRRQLSYLKEWFNSSRDNTSSSIPTGVKLIFCLYRVFQTTTGPFTARSWNIGFLDGRIDRQTDRRRSSIYRSISSQSLCVSFFLFARRPVALSICLLSVRPDLSSVSQSISHGRDLAIIYFWSQQSFPVPPERILRVNNRN